MKQRTALLLASMAAVAVVHSVISILAPARVHGTADLPPVVALGSLPARTNELVGTHDLRVRPDIVAPTAAPAAMLLVDRQAEQLASLGGRATASELENASMAAVTDADGEVRVQAVELLGDTRQPQYVAILAAALADRDSEVRLAAIHALVRHGNDEALHVLSAGFPNFDPDMREFALAMVPSLGGEAELPVARREESE